MLHVTGSQGLSIPTGLQEGGDSAGNCLHYFPNAASLSQMAKLPLSLLLEKTHQAAKSLQGCFFRVLEAFNHSLTLFTKSRDNFLARLVLWYNRM